MSMVFGFSFGVFMLYFVYCLGPGQYLFAGKETSTVVNCPVASITVTTRVDRGGVTYDRPPRVESRCDYSAIGGRVWRHNIDARNPDTLWIDADKMSGIKVGDVLVCVAVWKTINVPLSFFPDGNEVQYLKDCSSNPQTRT